MIGVFLAQWFVAAFVIWWKLSIAATMGLFLWWLAIVEMRLLGWAPMPADVLPAPSGLLEYQLRETFDATSMPDIQHRTDRLERGE